MAAVRQLMLEHGGAAEASQSSVLRPMVRPELAIVELPFWKIEERLLAYDSLPGMPAPGERRDAKMDLTWILVGFDHKSMSSPDQALNTAKEPFFPVEVMDLAKKIRDTADEALLLPLLLLLLLLLPPQLAILLPLMLLLLVLLF